MRKYTHFLLIGVICFLCSCEGNSNTTNEPYAVIFDTDVGNDIDDVLALQMLFNYEKKNMIELLGITIGKCNPYSIQYVDAYCRLNNRGDIPLGFAYNGVNPEDNKYLRPTLDTLINGNRILVPKRSINDSVPEGYKLMRKLLASQKDSSVIIIAVGPETNLARLLNSGPDEFSNLDGRALVEKKVVLLSVMGGLYGNEFDFPEWNIIQDLDAAQTVFSEWPTKLVASGWEVGNKLLYPHQSVVNDFNFDHPLRVSYALYDTMPFDRPTWDLTSVLYAVEQDKAYFDLSSKGNIKIDEEGKSIFTEDENGLHHYLIHAESNKDFVLNSLVEAVTSN